MDIVFRLEDGSFGIPLPETHDGRTDFVIIEGLTIPQACRVAVAVRALRECADRLERAGAEQRKLG